MSQMNNRLNWFIAIAVFVIDQGTKIAAESYLKEGQSIPVLPGFFNLTLVYNPGAAFGMFGGLPDFWRRAVLICVSVIALFVVFRFMKHEAKDDSWAQAALAAVLGGAVGNIVDRFRFDAVVDFLDFYVNSYHWPAFNIADSAISVGVFILVIRLLFGPSSIEAKESGSTELEQNASIGNDSA